MSGNRGGRRLLQIVADGKPGGGTTAVLGICDDLLADGGWQVSLITESESYAARQAAERGVSVHACEFFASRFDLSIPWKLKRLIDGIRPDLIHVHGGRAGHQFSLFPLRDLKCKIVYTVHGYHFLNKTQPYRLLGGLAERHIARRVDHVCFVSNGDRDIAVRHGFLAGGVSHSVVYNGIDARELSSEAAVPVTHDLIFVGRMERQKNPQFAVDVIAKLRDAPVTLLMVGGGALEAEVRARAAALAADRLITFTGPLPRKEAIVALRRAKIFLFPSRWEGLPIGPMEAMFCGLPVVGSRIAGTDEVVSDGEDGVLIDGFDAQVYADRIRELLADDSLRQRYIENGRRKVQTLFMRRQSSEKYLALYDRFHAAG